MTQESIVSTFLNGFNHPSTIEDSLTLLDDNYHFTDPTVTINSKLEFIDVTQELAKVLTGVEVKIIAVTGDWVAVHYEFYSSIDGVEVNKANEWFRVEQGKIKESHLLYDATKWRIIFESLKA